MSELGNGFVVEDENDDDHEAEDVGEVLEQPPVFGSNMEELRNVGII